MLPPPIGPIDAIATRGPALARVFWTCAVLAAVAVVAATSPALAQAQNPDKGLTFFRIGTGSTSGIYFPIGGLIASAISNPPGSRQCDRGGSCGVPGLISVAQATMGSVDNIEAIASGALESGLAQADVATWAYNGTGIFKGKKPVTNLRAIANLYPESIHVVVRRAAKIRGFHDLVGKRVSLDAKGSGTQVNARLILRRHNIALDRIKLAHVQLGPAIDMMHAGKLDAFFFVGGFPVAAIAELARKMPIKLLAISGEFATRLLKSDRFFTRTVIPAGTYKGVRRTRTVSVGAQWFVDAKLDDDLVYGVVRALWHKNTRHLLDSGHRNAKLISLKTALSGIAVPLHPGAERYYREAGLIK